MQLVLNGADVYCSDDAALFVKKAEKVFVTLADGTVNRLASGSEYSDNAKVKNRKSVVFSKTDLTINGNGSLEINGEYMHGLEIDNDFAATGGTINISAPEDGIKADKSIKLANADITIECTDDGMSTDEIEGYIYIESGYVYVNCSDNGIWSAGDIIIAGGDTTVYAGDAGLYAGGSFNIKDGELTAIVDDVDGNYGIEAYNDINILGGSVKISLLNNGFSQDVRWGESSEGVLNINGGSLIAAGDKSAVSSAGDIQGSQGAVLCTSSSGIHSGTQIYLCDENGDALLSWAAPCSFSSLLISCPEMSVGGTYYVVVGGIDSAVTLDEKLAFWDDSQS